MHDKQRVTDRESKYPIAEKRSARHASRDPDEASPVSRWALMATADLSLRLALSQ